MLQKGFLFHVSWGKIEKGKHTAMMWLMTGGGEEKLRPTRTTILHREEQLRPTMTTIVHRQRCQRQR